ncbi:MAG: lamin tail domain-containing protein, partial [Anaerolineales bacterium]|nr:lamin tail domain-containing protein [Anaerolineales bacterium]
MRVKPIFVTREAVAIAGFLLLVITIFILSTSNAAARSAESRSPQGVQSTSVLVINEIDYDQPGTDAAEYIELKNVSGAALDLDPYQVELVNGSGPSVYLTIDLPAFSLPDGDYYVICANAATVPNCDLDISPDTNLIQNGAPDAVAIRWTINNQVFDAVSYEGDTAAPYTEGSGIGLEDNSAIVQLGISRYPDGVDTHQNNVDLSPRCITPGEANTANDTNCDGSATPTPTATATNTPTPTPTATPAPSTARIYLSADSAGTVGQLTYGTEDVILYDQAGGFWAMLFDGSDVGLANTVDIDALLFLPSGRLIMSFAAT